MRKPVQEKEVEEEVPEDLLRSILRAPVELVVLVRDRDRVYGDCLPKSPHSPQVAVTYTRSTGVAPNTNMKNFGLARSTEAPYQGRGGWGVGVEGKGWGRERRAGGKASRGWAAEGAASPRDNICNVKSDRRRV